jgi:hypothetical protein
VAAVGSVIDDAMERLGSSVDELAAWDPADGTDGELAAALLVLRREADRIDAVFARLAAAGHRRGIGRGDGAVSTVAWLRHRAGMRHHEAKAAVEQGDAADLLAATGEAWRGGEISTGAARTIFAARVADHDEALLGSEPILLDLARRGASGALGLAAAHCRNLARADGTEPHDRDGLTLAPTSDGSTVVAGTLSDEQAEVVTTALHAYVDPPAEGDTRTAAQRYASALAQICRVALDHANDHAVHHGHGIPQVLVVVDWATLLDSVPGRLDGQFTGSIHPRAARKLLCDSSISRILTGPDGLPLDVGRSTRTIPPAIRRAVIARDGGCRYPGCDRPPGWCQIHHVVHWVDGGRTAIVNLVMLCDRHHHVVHQVGWIVKFDGRDLRVLRPDGIEIQ